MDFLQELTPQHVARQALLSNITPSATNDPKEIAQSIKSMLAETSISNTELIAGAVIASAAVVGFACYAIYNRLETVDDEVAGFEEMVKRHASTYFIAKKDSDRTDPDRYLNIFFESLAEFENTDIGSLLIKFAGLYRQEISKNNNPGTIYSTYSMASCPLMRHFERSQDDGQTIDEARQALTMFIRGSASSLLLEIESILKTDYFENAKIFVQGEEHLRELNSTRTLIILLINIALNLLYPMNPNTKKPVSVANSITLCTNFRKIISDMLSDLESSKYKSYKLQICKPAEFNDFLLTLDARIADLQQAYRHNLKTTVNLTEIINNSYSIIQSMNNMTWLLLYPGRIYPDYANLLDKIIHLDYLIRNDSTLPGRLIRKLQASNLDTSKIGLNSVASTVIDVIAIFSFHDESKRNKALKDFKPDDENAGPYRRQFVDTLKYIDTYYLQPLENNHSGFSKIFGSNPAPKIAATQFFVCFTTLTLEIYGINFIYNELAGIKDANSQIRIINDGFLKGDSIYTLDTFNDLPIKSRLKGFLQAFIKSKVEMLMATRLINAIETLISRNQHYLFSQKFQEYLELRLDNLGRTYLMVNARSVELVEEAQKDRHSDKDLVAILSNIYAENPQTKMSLQTLFFALDENIRRVKIIISRSVFDDKLAENERQLIAFIQRNDSSNLFASADEYSDFYRVLGDDVRDKLQFASVDEQHLKIESREAELSRDIMVSCNISKEAPLLSNSYFQLQAYFNIIGGVSLALLVVGLLTVLLMTFGVQAIPIIATIGSEVTSALMIAGFVSAAAGGIGLASSYFAPKFFKSPVVKLNHIDEVVEDNSQDKELVVSV